jgi:hypothetical protein
MEALLTVAKRQGIAWTTAISNQAKRYSVALVTTVLAYPFILILWKLDQRLVPLALFLVAAAATARLAGPRSASLLTIMVTALLFLTFLFFFPEKGSPKSVDFLLLLLGQLFLGLLLGTASRHFREQAGKSIRRQKLREQQEQHHRLTASLQSAHERLARLKAEHEETKTRLTEAREAEREELERQLADEVDRHSQTIAALQSAKSRAAKELEDALRETKAKHGKELEEAARAAKSETAKELEEANIRTQLAEEAMQQAQTELTKIEAELDSMRKISAESLEHVRAHAQQEIQEARGQAEKELEAARAQLHEQIRAKDEEHERQRSSLGGQLAEHEQEKASLRQKCEELELLVGILQRDIPSRPPVKAYGSPASPAPRDWLSFN